MVEGPFTAEEAAKACGCLPHELRPGPLGAVEELDKIRTIYDGSVGGQNDSIRSHTVERTTAPTTVRPNCSKTLALMGQPVSI